MPLRSVEAASRDDAIAAAKEQFGPAARVVGVRRVRSGGVLGFFATERYIAEVAPEPAGVAVVPVAAPARPAGALIEDPDTGSLAAYGSPLSSASPARGRIAPPRNGAAAWAAEAARSGAPAPRTTPALVGASAGGGRRPAEAAPRAPEPADDVRVDELAGLLGVAVPPPARPAAPVVEPPARAGVAPASFPRATRCAPAPALPTEDVPDAPATPASGAPSPFTAALARMVAGDRDVQHAVREALETSDVARPGDEQDGLRAPQPLPETTGAAVPSPATHQEEETVGDQVIAPPSPSLDERTEFDERPEFDERTDFATWAEEPSSALESDAAGSFPAGSFPAVTAPVDARSIESFLSGSLPDVPSAVAVEPTVSREEAIAEMLRAALAEGHSDDALAGILRKVVAGDSPAVVELPEADLPVVEVPAVEVAAVEVPVADLPEVEAPVAATPQVEVAEPVVEAPAPPAVSQFDLFSSITPPAAVAPAAPAPVEPAPVSLWGDVAPAAPATPTTPSETPAAAADARGWAEVAPVVPAPAVGMSLFGAPSVGAPLADEAVVEPVVSEVETADAVAAEPVAVEAEAEAEAVAAPAEPVVSQTLATDAPAEESGPAVDLEVAPVLARTASDPAPVSRSMSMDATTVMPPLSLLPGSSSRGRGLPPVPPRTGRPPVPPSSTRASGTPSGSTAPDRPSPATRAPDQMATVTRLPVAPLMATPATPDMPELADLADLIEADGWDLLDPPVLPAVLPARPARVRIAPPSTPAEVLTRLADLGVPADLLDPSFRADVESQGTYAALTRALGDRLPEAPELPSGAGDVLFVVGPGVETLRAARSLAATLRLDPDRVQWATRGDLVGLAPETSRMSTIDAALRRRLDAAESGTVTIVAVDAPLRTDAYWMAQMMAVWSPVAVWAVVEATRKPEDVEHWLDGLSRVDALVVQDTDLSANPAAVLDRLAAPVAVVDGVRATPHRWASVLCERLESAPA